MRPDIRAEIWIKLWGNVAFNPISAPTGGTLRQIRGDPRARALARAVMTEAEAVAKALGVEMPAEIDAIVDAVTELGRVVQVATPAIEAVYTPVRQKAALMGLYS